jgi:ferrous iron transport protein A
MHTQVDSSLLSDIQTGQNAIITSLKEGNEINRRLTSLGFTPGVNVEIVQNFGRGPMIVSVRGMRVALGRGEAAKIFVEQGCE